MDDEHHEIFYQMDMILALSLIVLLVTVGAVMLLAG